MKKLFKQHSRSIRIYILKEVIEDPYEKNLNKDSSIEYIYPIKAIVSNIPSEKLVWKVPGIKLDKSVNIIIEKKDMEKIKLSSRIEIEEEFYGYRDDIGRMTMVDYDNQYVSLILEVIKND